MINQVSFSLIVFLIVFIILCFVLMICISPLAWREYLQILEKYKSTKTIRPLRPSISDYLEKLSESKDEEEIQKLIQTIRSEAMRTVRIQPQTDQGHQADSILKWLDRFIIQRHISDLKNYGESAQIRYDSRKKDFKLMIVT